MGRVLCLVFVAAVQVPQVHAADVYGDCLPVCLQACKKDNGYTFCEMKCDTDCFNKEIEMVRLEASVCESAMAWLLLCFWLEKNISLVLRSFVIHEDVREVASSFQGLGVVEAEFDNVKSDI
ncbi:hypothetical protein QYF36_014063 [Acer negundo]|nr:hypothetical protein QYF36_014063 [Acer negundo]